MDVPNTVYEEKPGLGIIQIKNYLNDKQIKMYLLFIICVIREIYLTVLCQILLVVLV